MGIQVQVQVGWYLFDGFISEEDLKLWTELADVRTTMEAMIVWLTVSLIRSAMPSEVLFASRNSLC